MAVKQSADTIARPEAVNREDIREPRRFKVILLNDDITTMEFVVDLLCRVFGKALTEATAIMLQVHNTGRGICGIYTHEIAEAKVARVRAEALQAGYPLKCIMEED